ncbi:hypothetical protein AAG906_022618 [Vitis piasezkii]
MEVKRRTARSLVARLSSVSQQTRTEALCELRLISKHDPDSRCFIADAGAVPYLCETLYSALPSNKKTLPPPSSTSPSPAANSSCPRAVSSTLSLMLRSPPPPRRHPGMRRHPLQPSPRHRLHSWTLYVPHAPPRSIKMPSRHSSDLYPLNRASMGGSAPSPDARRVETRSEGLGIGVLVDLLDPSTGSSIRTKENAVSALLNLEAGMGLYDGIAVVADGGSPKGKSKAIALLKLLDGGEPRFASNPDREYS